jgi:WXG100 family type VII secretion target
MQLLLGYVALDAAVAAVHDAVAELADGRRRAEALVDRLLDGGWSGRAADSYSAAWQEWLAGEQQVREALNAIEAALAGTGQHLAATDHEAQAHLGRLAERLGG